ncbi:uncharacterized protein BJX67DRAFT_124873 [Aspergillus lucknowensis]|uniref:Uncharacterized protein n=1 Tax=Aspergillus lucknowensis TaxID=176173 RepID=A0ABR4LQN0_9EURO
MRRSCNFERLPWLQKLSSPPFSELIQAVWRVNEEITRFTAALEMLFRGTELAPTSASKRRYVATKPKDQLSIKDVLEQMSKKPTTFLSATENPDSPSPPDSSDRELRANEVDQREIAAVRLLKLEKPSKEERPAAREARLAYNRQYYYNLRKNLTQTEKRDPCQRRLSRRELAQI